MSTMTGTTNSTGTLTGGTGRRAARAITSGAAAELDWQTGALCAQTGPDFFFPEPGSSVRDAKRLCAACPGRAACLEYALSNDERFGVWGGLSEQERLRLRRR